MNSFNFSDEVKRARKNGAPIVALESTIISHGLPRPKNLEIAKEIENTVRGIGAVPATIAMLNGVVHVGLEEAELLEIATSDLVIKASVRDLAILAQQKRHAATTVAATSHIAQAAGISIFATGGLGGVHRGARDTWDESADLYTLARTDITVVCAGVKSILDVAATLERIESLSIGLVGQFCLGAKSPVTLCLNLSVPSDLILIMEKSVVFSATCLKPLILAYFRASEK